MKDNLARLVPAIERELQEAANRRDRQQIQSALRESEDRWQLALRGNNDGIWDWNIQSNQVFFSARWKKCLVIPKTKSALIIKNGYSEYIQTIAIG
jgi:PAS domain-containing protein